MHTHNSGVHKHDLKSWKIHCLRSISTAAFFQPYRQVTESPQEFFPHHFSATALVKVTSYIHVAKPIDYYSVFISMNNSKTSGRVNHSLPVFSNIASLPSRSPVSPRHRLLLSQSSVLFMPHHSCFCWLWLFPTFLFLSTVCVCLGLAKFGLWSQTVSALAPILHAHCPSNPWFPLRAALKYS